MGRIFERISKAYTVARETQWKSFLSALIVFYCFIKEAKVADPFLYKYQTDFQNLTADTLNGEVGTYISYKDSIHIH